MSKPSKAKSKAASRAVDLSGVADDAGKRAAQVEATIASVHGKL